MSRWETLSLEGFLSGSFLTESLFCIMKSHIAYLQVVKDEEERFCGEPLVKLHSVRVGRWHLVVERQGGARVPHQVLPVISTQRVICDVYSGSSLLCFIYIA